MPLTFDDMLSHLEVQIYDLQNQRRLANQRFQDAYQKEWQSIRESSKYLEDWGYYLPPYNEQQRMDNLRSKVLPVIRNELLCYTQEPGDYDEPLRRWQSIEENMPERRRVICKGKPARFIGNQRRPGKSDNCQNKRKREEQTDSTQDPPEPAPRAADTSAESTTNTINRRRSRVPLWQLELTRSWHEWTSSKKRCGEIPGSKHEGISDLCCCCYCISRQ
ncbi:hypothetical protein I7I53_03283 [Histoplasma capsulatum var. duboisii H88]|uniref:Uncharacterized protein n=2 Tax=Ajellomyces capsulatus TaxID=5037 RepID=A0A8A1LSL5_AJEC8|nr:conserved hypothetical protein [Histoplasma capsulatum H143]QSS55414.1 hypothetical protein I7I53_03283 [Histoplasma capsulatum var. duboisii H88]